MSACPVSLIMNRIVSCREQVLGRAPGKRGAHADDPARTACEVGGAPASRWRTAIAAVHVYQGLCRTSRRTGRSGPAGSRARDGGCGRVGHRRPSGAVRRCRGGGAAWPGRWLLWRRAAQACTGRLGGMGYRGAGVRRREVWLPAGPGRSSHRPTASMPTGAPRWFSPPAPAAGGPPP